MYIVEKKWDNHLNKFNTIILPNMKHCIPMYQQKKKILVIISLPKSIVVISAKCSAHRNVTIEALDSMVGSEIKGKKRPRNLQV